MCRPCSRKARRCCSSYAAAKTTPSSRCRCSECHPLLLSPPATPTTACRAAAHVQNDGAAAHEATHESGWQPLVQVAAGEARRANRVSTASRVSPVCHAYRISRTLLGSNRSTVNPDHDVACAASSTSCPTRRLSSSGGRRRRRRSRWRTVALTGALTSAAAPDSQGARNRRTQVAWYWSRSAGSTTVLFSFWTSTRCTRRSCRLGSRPSPPSPLPLVPHPSACPRSRPALASTANAPRHGLFALAGIQHLLHHHHAADPGRGWQYAARRVAISDSPNRRAPAFDRQSGGTSSRGESNHQGGARRGTPRAA